MSKKAAETTIKTSIRIRPCSEKEKEQYPGPCQVQAAPGEVRLYAKCSVTNRTAGGARESSPSGIRRPSTPTHRPGTPTAVGSVAAQAVWQAVAMQQQMGSDYQSYPFANVFGPEVGNEEVYDGSGCRDIVDSVLGGCNGTIFVYGQTGAGKTHTMDSFTQLVLQQLYAAAARDDSNCEISITVSAVELYNEVLRCLLSGRENLQLRMGAAGPSPGGSQGIVLEGADERPCSTHQEAAAVIEQATSSRSVGETRANARSSRSHLIVRIKVETLQLGNGLNGLSGVEAAGARAGPSGPASVTFSLLNLVDLAGSERVDKSGSSDTPLRLREALNINKSLLCLGNVVTALAERSEGRRNTHIPYRDSKLTRLLEDSLGGNAATALMACITPLPEWHLEQTRATLEFAARAARVVCSPQKNVLKLAPNPSANDSSDLIAQLQAEVTQLRALLAQQQGADAALETTTTAAGQTGKLQSSTWDSCSSSSSGAMADAAAAAEAAVATVDGCAAALATSPRSRAKWTHRLRLSVGGNAARAAAAAAAVAAAATATARATDSIAEDEVAAGAGGAVPTVQSSSGELFGPAHHRSSGSSHGSLLWKFFHHGKSVSVVDKLPTLTEAGCIDGASANLRSTGLLMLPAGGKQCFSSSGGGNSSSNGGGHNTGQGVLSRWASFQHHSSNGGSMARSRSSETGMFAKTRSSSCGGSVGQVVSGSFRAGSTSGGGSQVSTCIDGGVNNIASQVAATEAAIALRDHIIKQLVTALQQKKAEIKALREQQLALQRQLEAAEGEGIASKQKLRELAEGIQALAAAREEEFEKWKGHLEGVEVALHAAQQESLTYRQEALALVQQLTQLQARYRSLQSDQLRRSSLVQSANQSMLMTANHKESELVQLHTAAVQQSTQLQQCLSTLISVEECLRQLLTHTAAPLTSIHSGVMVADSSNAAGDLQHTAASAASNYSCVSSAMKGEISSHMIQTVSTRYDMSSGLVTRAAGAGIGHHGKTLAQLEEMLDKLRGVVPLLRNAAANANSNSILTSSHKALPIRESGKEHLSSILSGDSADSDGSEKIKASHGPVYDTPPAAPAKCHKCDTLKPLLALMQKLKDEVTQLRATVKARDAELASAAATSAAMKRDLEESRQQVGSLQERIDELAEELEAARAAAAAAAASAYAAAAAAEEAAGSKEQTPAESAAAADAAGHVTASYAITLDTVESPSIMFSPEAQLSRECSTSNVPLMSDDTPLSELHAQILTSWHALAMPRTYRAAFVLGHGVTLESAPWSDRLQCQAHVALLACLHQLQEDHPSAAATQQSILAEEAALLVAGLSRMSQMEFSSLAQTWGIPASTDATSQRSTLLLKMWAPCSAAAADQLAVASAAACRQCLASAPPVEMAALTIRSNASLMAATSNALAEAAS